ncbi:unnamed protein product [Trichobilharzia szidati]|nr:unnamed protein product [Trichobilharzia szidati]
MIQLQEVHQEQEEQHQQQQIQQNHHACNNEDILNQIKASVHNLYEFKTKYLNEWADKYGVLNDSMFQSWMQSDTICSMINESCELMNKKNELVQLKFEQTISMLKAYESIFMHTSSVSPLQKAEFCYQYGRAFNAIDSDMYTGNLHDTEENDLTCQAIQWLTKALKFNPQHTDAWCELGDSCWRQGDPVQAASHFRQALKIDDMFGKTLTCWLQAVCLDPDWPAPQNCIKRIIKFILEWKTFMQQLSEIHSCTGSCSMEKKSSDQRRQQQRQEIDEFIVPLNPLTKLLTVSTKENSNWSENNGDNQTNQSSPNYDNNKLTLDIKDKTALSRLLGPCCPLINNSVVDQHDDNSVVDDKSVANMKQKGSDKTNNSNNNKKKKRLKSAKHTNSSSNTLTNSNELRLLTSVIDTSQIHVGLFKDLQIGLNKNTVCVGRVYAELPADTDLARNFLLVDAYGMPFTVRVYNIGKGKGPIRKDIIVIPNPFVEEIFIEGFILHSCITALSKLDSKYLSEDIINKLANLNKDTDTTIDKSDNMKESDFTSLPPSHLLSNSTADLHIRLIRIPLPDLLVVNGQPVGSSWTGAPVFKTVFFTGI